MGTCQARPRRDERGLPHARGERGDSRVVLTDPDGVKRGQGRRATTARPPGDHGRWSASAALAGGCGPAPLWPPGWPRCRACCLSVPPRMPRVAGAFEVVAAPFSSSGSRLTGAHTVAPRGDEYSKPW